MLGFEPRCTGGSRRRGVALAALALIALLLHAGFLGGLNGPWGSAASPRAEPLRVRMLEPAPSPVAPAIEPAAPQAEPVSRAAPRPRRPANALAPRAAESVSPPVPAEPEPPRVPAEPAAPAEPIQPVTPQEPAPAEAPAPTGLPAIEPQAGTDSERELPLYRTLIPPAATLRYQLRRGALQGSGELQWRPDGERYEARLEGRLAGFTVLTQTSQGSFDEAGVAPLRFTDKRIRGDLRAANFQREAGKISFSGPAVEYPLLVGSQDRLSWMIQLAAVVAAEPPRMRDRGKVVIHVVGARGDSKLWVFRFVALEAIETGAGVVQAAKFVREASDAYDTRVEVWLDPLRHHLPARAVLRAGPDDDGLELLLQDADLAPAPVPKPLQ